MWLQWLPWRYIVRRVAQAHGFTDPINVLSALRRFAQPAEVNAPLELIRAGVVFHARGLMNTGAIQHNLDWVWPYWVHRQFDPRDPAFIPRAFSVTHVNLTHRNWTAIGLPGCDWFPIVDPRGLLTPFWDGWSLDAWVLAEDDRRLIPSQLKTVEQRLDLAETLAVETRSSVEGLEFEARVDMDLDGRLPFCRKKVTARCSKTSGWLIVTLRPANPEGVSFLHKLSKTGDPAGWAVEGEQTVEFDCTPDRHRFSVYRDGDVFLNLPDGDQRQEIECDVGMATAAALFRLEKDQPRTVEIRVPQRASQEEEIRLPSGTLAGKMWKNALAGACRIKVPDENFSFLYDAALKTLILHSPLDTYPGPYTYRRFWFRDAAFIVHGLLVAGLKDVAERVIDRFPTRQNANGYFHSQKGEWDSNGEVLWTLQRYCELTGTAPKHGWRRPVEQGGAWILRKRTSASGDAPHAGLLPAGFSAEHLGPSDFYYWDDFWSIAGLRAAADLLEESGCSGRAPQFCSAAEDLFAAVRRSLNATRHRRSHAGIPASPYRRMDPGAMGSLVAGYPLGLLAPEDESLQATTQFLLDHSFVDGGFFQDMIHSGINAYLTLHVAQVLLRAGDLRALDLVRTVAELATSTGQWPEAIHPRTHGGCMGDGQHVWAAAEWIVMVRNGFVREEGDRLILGSGVLPEWIDAPEPIRFGPTPTAFGPVSLTIDKEQDRIAVRWQASWRRLPRVELRLPGFAPVENVDLNRNELILEREAV